MPPRPITLDELNREDIFDQIRREATDAVSFLLVREAWDLARGIENALKAGSDQGRVVSREREYRRLLGELKAIALPLMNELEVLDTFRKSISPPLHNSDIDLGERLRLHLITIPDLEDRDGVKHNIFQALQESAEPLTNVGITRDDGRVTPGTVGNWIRELHQTIGTDVSSLNLAQFFTKNPSVKRLTEADRRSLGILFNLYVQLGRFSFEPEGFDEEPTFLLPDGSIKIFSHGQFTDVTVPWTKISGARSARITEVVRTTVAKPSIATPVAQLMAKYEQYVASQQASKALERAVAPTAGTDLKKLKQELGAAITTKDVNRSLACLRLLAKSGGLTRILVDEPTVQKWLNDYLERKYGKGAGARVAIDDLLKRPTSPEAVIEFLQFVLQERLALSGEDSALVGVELGLLLKAAGQPAFEHLAYGDENTVKFSWVEHRIENGKFVREVK